MAPRVRFERTRAMPTSLAGWLHTILGDLGCAHIFLSPLTSYPAPVQSVYRSLGSSWAAVAFGRGWFSASSPHGGPSPQAPGLAACHGRRTILFSWAFKAFVPHRGPGKPLKPRSHSSWGAVFGHRARAALFPLPPHRSQATRPYWRAFPGQFQAYNRDSATESRKVDDRQPVCRPASTDQSRGEGLPLNLGKRALAPPGPKRVRDHDRARERPHIHARKRARGTLYEGMGGPGGKGRIFFPLFLPERGKGGVPAEKICHVA